MGVYRSLVIGCGPLVFFALCFVSLLFLLSLNLTTSFYTANQVNETVLDSTVI